MDYDERETLLPAAARLLFPEAVESYFGRQISGAAAGGTRSPSGNLSLGDIILYGERETVARMQGCFFFVDTLCCTERIYLSFFLFVLFARWDEEGMHICHDYIVGDITFYGRKISFC